VGVLGKEPLEIKKDLREGRITVAVYGMGRVGLPIAVAWLRAGAKVIGVDINHGIVESLNHGKIPFDDEPGMKEGIEMGIKERRFYATSDGIEASKTSDVKIVVVATTLNAQKKLDNKNLVSAAENIGKGLKKGDAVIVECTVPPLTTELLVKRILEEKSGLKAEEDFVLAYSPERIYMGQALKDIEENYPKVVGGVGPKSTEVVASLYECIAKKGVVRLKRAREAEASKVFEGIYRDVNIALVNELAKFCDSAGIDFMEARSAANSQPFCHLHLPGIGVGGLCIPVYPHFVTSLADDLGLEMHLTKCARSVNESMPEYTFGLMKKVLDRIGLELRKAKVGVLGLSFRGDVSDIRQSPAVEFINLIRNQVAAVRAYDPFVRSVDGIDTSENLEDLLMWADVLVVATDHSTFKGLDLRRFGRALAVVDGRNVIDPQLLPKNSTYVGIGRLQTFFYKS
jgi:nucleotide sugar dehydrogenase